MTSDELERVRLDKWLWAARFFKTRAIAATAIETGKVEVNGERAKRAKQLQIGDSLRIRIGPYHHIVTVRGLSEIRGPAPVAAKLYEETPESRAKRAAEEQRRRTYREPAAALHGRPTKRDRRVIDKLSGGD